MTSPSNTAWAREEALALAYKYAVGHLVDEAARKIEVALLAADRKAKEECAQQAINTAHELKRNADGEAEDSPERAALLSEALIAWDIVARIRSTLHPQQGGVTRG